MSLIYAKDSDICLFLLVNKSLLTVYFLSLLRVIGEIGDKFYIIIDGLVSVEVPDPDYVPTPPPEESDLQSVTKT